MILEPPPYGGCGVWPDSIWPHIIPPILIMVATIIVLWMSL